MKGLNDAATGARITTLFFDRRQFAESETEMFLKPQIYIYSSAYGAIESNP